MNFDELLRDDRLRQHKTSQQEIKEMLYLVDRDLIDASIEGLSSDRRFMIIYDPVLTLATIPLTVPVIELTVLDTTGQSF